MRLGPDLREVLTQSLPPTFRGFPVLVQDAPSDPEVNVPVLAGSNAPSFHSVSIFSLPSFLERIGLEPQPRLDAAFWLTVTEQQLLECTAGPLFRDDHGDLTSLRTQREHYSGLHIG